MLSRPLVKSNLCSGRSHDKAIKSSLLFQDLYCSAYSYPGIGGLAFCGQIRRSVFFSFLLLTFWNSPDIIKPYLQGRRKHMGIRTNYNHTLYASYTGYITQAVVNTFIPLLFLTFQSTYQIPLDKITLLVTVNFAIQLTVDLLSAKFVDKIGYRICIVAAHLFAAAGLIGLSILPDCFPDPFAGLLTSVCLYAVGGGLIEVLISPIVEACPTERKAAAMSLLDAYWLFCFPHCFSHSPEFKTGVFSRFCGRRFPFLMHCISLKFRLHPLKNRTKQFRLGSCSPKRYFGCWRCSWSARALPSLP